jgi:hypothetical protein
VNAEVIKKYVLQAQANKNWYDVAEFDVARKREAMDLLDWKKANHTQTKWRIVQRTIRDKKIA